MSSDRPVEISLPRPSTRDEDLVRSGTRPVMCHTMHHKRRVADPGIEDPFARGLTIVAIDEGKEGRHGHRL